MLTYADVCYIQGAEGEEDDDTFQPSGSARYVGSSEQVGTEEIADGEDDDGAGRNVEYDERGCVVSKSVAGVIICTFCTSFTSALLVQRCKY